LISAQREFSHRKAMKSSEQKAIVKDMQLASLEVLRKTARDVFEEKIMLSTLSGNVIGTTDCESNSVMDCTDLDNTNGGNSHGDVDLLKIDEKDLVLGRVIGRGAFCVVRECSHAPFTSSAGRGENLSSRSGNYQFVKRGGLRLGNFGRHLIGRRKRRNETNGSSLGTSTSSIGSNHDGTTRSSRRMSRNNNRTRYVVKQLSPELKRLDKINFLKGTVDLAMETRFLSLLDHENIICLVGVASNGAFSDGYFIVLEKLNETLGRRVKAWMDMDRQCKGITGVFTGSKKKAQRLQSERISAACSLVAGMEYLHQRNIVFRDLKPDNIGFTNDGILKIFDFGLAKELRNNERVEDGLYNMTGCTGSIRYMSPENLQGKPYNLKTDVYSWAMIMWNILALEPPFALYTEQMIIDRVCNRGYRPKIFSTWSARMSKSIRLSWSANYEERPSFSEISAELTIERMNINSVNSDEMG